MAKDTKKISRQVDFNTELSTWKGFTDWLRAQEDEVDVKRCMMFEIGHENRPLFIDRARTRYNRIRAQRELKEIEALSGKTISVAGL